MSLGKQAKTLSKKQEDIALAFIKESTRYPLRNKVIFLLSIKAGLRAKEISAITWDMLIDPQGEISEYIHLQNVAAKGKSGRIIPINKQLKEAILDLKQSTQNSCFNPKQHLILSERGWGCSAKVIVNWFKNLYTDLNFHGCTSHSGRRTFVTRAAQEITKAGGSIKDVQAMAGHSNLNTTQRYIDSNDKARKIVVDLI